MLPPWIAGRTECLWHCHGLSSGRCCCVCAVTYCSICCGGLSGLRAQRSLSLRGDSGGSFCLCCVGSLRLCDSSCLCVCLSCLCGCALRLCGSQLLPQAAHLLGKHLHLHRCLLRGTDI